ncbi:MAG: PAS domain-containing protein [bacterium]
MPFSNMGLKWRLLIPILTLSFLGTTALVFVAHRSQQILVAQSEKALLEGHYGRLLQSLDAMRTQASALAWAMAQDPHVGELLGLEDRDGLMLHLNPLYQKLRSRLGVTQIHLHRPPGISFLRVHSPDRYGDVLSDSRRELLSVFQSGEEASGLVEGATGYSMRAVVPVDLDGQRLGTLEVGLSLEVALFGDFKKKWACDITVHLPPPQANKQGLILASTLESPQPMGQEDFQRLASKRTASIMIPLPQRHDVSAVVGPILGPSGLPVALVEIRVSRIAVLQIMERYLRQMLLVELVGLLAAFILVWLVVERFLRPIRGMVKAATEIASGERVHMDPGGQNELGQLARALRSMVGYLEASRERTRDYARNLEKEVEERTQQLRTSEERYRNLLQRLPLVVYQMTGERILKFSSAFSKELLGMAPEELLSQPHGWDHLILPEERQRVLCGFSEAVSKGVPWAQEYRLRTPQGRILLVREQATPLKDEQGQTYAMEGILSDITLQKQVQDMTLQTEQLKTLGEISARLAHEIRNPLTSVGGLSRRLLKELGEGHQARNLAQAIVQEVQRLETVLHMILAYIQPVEVELSPGDPGVMLRKILQDLAPEFQSRGRRLLWEIPEELPLILMDSRNLPRALESLLRRPLFHMEEDGEFFLCLNPEHERLVMRLRYRAPSLGLDDLEHFFYPFLAQETPDPCMLELPVARTILYKHGALVKVGPGSATGEVIIELSFPAAR